MYCGDETGSFVGQVGSHTSRFGYGGDEAPRVVVNSYAGRMRQDDPAASSRFFVPASCYRSRWAEADVWKTPLTGPTYDGTTTTDDDARLREPLTDPAAYLSQGGSIADWDAYETLWQSAMETMAVRRLKHSTGELLTPPQQKQQQSSSSSPGSTTVRPHNNTASTEFTCRHPLLAVTPGFTYPSLAVDGSYGATAVRAARRRERGRLVELLLETFDAPACFIVPESMTQAFSQGRSTALVVDVGHGGTRVTPVVDGLPLHGAAQRRTGRGGAWLTHTAWHALTTTTTTEDNKTTTSSSLLLRPRYQISHGVVDPTVALARRGIFHRWAMQDVVQECLSTVARLPATTTTGKTRGVFASSIDHNNRSSNGGNNGKKEKSKDKSDDEEEDDDEAMDEDNEDDDDDEGEKEESDDAMDAEPVSSSPAVATYELPDGTLIDLTTPVGRDLCRIPEAYFSETLPFGITPDASILDQHHTLTDLPLDKLIQASLLAVADVDVRKDLASNILLVGGGSLTGGGLEQRLSWQLRQLLPGKPKVLASAHAIERTAAGWIGGSILSSLGSFQQLWLGRTEYEEYGATLALQRFPE